MLRLLAAVPACHLGDTMSTVPYRVANVLVVVSSFIGAAGDGGVGGDGDVLGGGV